MHNEARDGLCFIYADVAHPMVAGSEQGLEDGRKPAEDPFIDAELGIARN